MNAESRILDLIVSVLINFQNQWNKYYALFVVITEYELPPDVSHE